MAKGVEQLSEDALGIWQAGVAAVRADRLMEQAVVLDGSVLSVGESELDLRRVRRLVVVGAGKAVVGMAEALEKILGDYWIKKTKLFGWINAPADCVRPLREIHVHAARPAGVNEPRPEGVVGTEAILKIVGELTPKDLCICLLSGGGSALLPAPVEGVSLDEKIALTRYMNAVGATVEELNAVRSNLSRIKGGGLLHACRAGCLATIVISDGPGDRLDVIASGPTVERKSLAGDAAEILRRYGAEENNIAPAALEYLRQRAAEEKAAKKSSRPPRQKIETIAEVIGNNAMAVDAAGVEAVRRGYSYLMTSATEPEGRVEDVAADLAARTLKAREGVGPDCIISGGEPTVELVDAARRGLGGRNQQLALTVLRRLEPSGLRGIAFVSGGTDGEDGPTDAAGAIVHERILAAMKEKRLDAEEFLASNDAYHFFESVGGLIKTGPTQTNVCDLRVAVVERS